jgi:hypothetical protein
MVIALDGAGIFQADSKDSDTEAEAVENGSGPTGKRKAKKKKKTASESVLKVSDTVLGIFVPVLCLETANLRVSKDTVLRVQSFSEVHSKADP